MHPSRTNGHSDALETAVTTWPDLRLDPASSAIQTALSLLHTVSRVPTPSPLSCSETTGSADRQRREENLSGYTIT